MPNLYEFEALRIDGRPLPLADLRGNVVLIVNTASQCGFTPQYDGLEALNRTYGPRGLIVLGFPCNQFGGQEPAPEADIAQFCRVNHGVSFPLMAKIDVNGQAAHPLYRWLVKEAPGLLGTTRIKWNFTKFLIGRDGQVRQRFSPRDAPATLAPAIEAALRMPAPA